MPNPSVTIRATGTLALILSLVPLPALAIGDLGNGDASIPVMQSWVEAMKRSPRGPFARLRWFCADGAVLQPKPHACAKHGGGIQHGEWNPATVAIRDAGYLIASVLAEIDPDRLMHGEGAPFELKQILLEQFLIAADDGWIYRRARSYRGALQAEDEARGARGLLLALVADPDWRERRYALLLDAARLLPHRRPGPSMTVMRELSSTIAEMDEGFKALRNQLHIRPTAEDATRVRVYAVEAGEELLFDDYERLAAAIDCVYTADAGVELSALVSRVKGEALRRVLRDAARRLARTDDPVRRLAISGRLMARIRDDLDAVGSPEVMLDALDVSRVLEIEAFTAASRLRERLGDSSRRERLAWLEYLTDALYGAGLVSIRERWELDRSLAALDVARLLVTHYRAGVAALARVPRWVDRRLRFHYQSVVDHLAGIEPRVRAYLYDRLRGSPLLFYSEVVDGLVADANRLAGVRHRVFDLELDGGMRALNPGLARGPLRMGGQGRFDPAGIYILPETTVDLPRVQGVLTAGEGNAVSHVQLLARNLGIPNVAVDRKLLSRLESMRDRPVVLAVSRGGVVRLHEDGPAWDEVFRANSARPPALLKIDGQKLELGVRQPLSLERISATDSGRIVGPKAAHLGELNRRFPGTVAPAVVLPFGMFRALLEQPIETGGPSTFQWMKTRYAALQKIAAGPAREAATRAFLARLREWIVNADPGDEFRDRLWLALQDAFGEDGSYGLFVRSDTNVEDLPGFTGAGLNLTVPHVVGFDAVLEAISRVWASPFTERAYTWRQAAMADPQHVYPAVLLMRSVAVEKSGVMVTVDVDSGAEGWLSIAVNEGIGGAVAGQAAEELRVHRDSGHTRLVAQATAPLKRVLGEDGGLSKLPASGADQVLREDEIDRLRELAHVLPERFPVLRDADGSGVPADVEFGFVDGELALFQIRPFLESAQARHNVYLAELDRELSIDPTRVVDLAEVPTRP